MYHERPVTGLRKFLFVLLFLLLTVFCAAALADTDYFLSPAPAKITLKDNRTVVTAENLGEHPELVAVMNMSRDSILADWQSRGVILQAWSAIKKTYTWLEITVTQDEDSAAYTDLMNHPDDKENWKAYINSFKNSETWKSQGYTFQSFEQHHAGSNYYLLMKYKRKTDSLEYRGYMARTVYQGYTIVFDLKANHAPRDSYPDELYRVINTFTVAEAASTGTAAETQNAEGTGTSDSGNTGDAAAETETPPVQGSSIIITKAPPLETNTNTFTIEGTTNPGAEVIATLMKNVTNSDPLNFTATAHAKTGAFTLKITIPEAEENIWLVTLTVYSEPGSDQLVDFKYFDPTTYKKTLIPLTLDAEVPSEIYDDKLVISGTTMKAVDVQCMVTDSTGTTIKNGDQKSHPNGTGRFNFKFTLTNEDQYSVTLVITKKGYEEKRFTYTVSRFLTEEARKNLVRKEAMHIGYADFVARMDQYNGKTMAFSVWITGIEQVGDEWKIDAAGQLTADGLYNQKMIFMAEQEPSFAVEEKHTLFGICRQPYQEQSEESIVSLPCLDLLFWDE